jgi:phosphate acetyltransferase
MDPIANVSTGSSDRDMSPKQFMSMITIKAKSNKQHMVLPEGHDPRILAAAAILLKEGICSVTTLGNPADVAKLAEQEGVDITGLKIIDYKTVDISDMVAALAKARKLEPEKATEMLRGDMNWFGTMMMYTGQADGMVSGAAHATADTMRPALQVIKAVPEVSLVSSVFFMLLQDGAKVFSDCGLVVNPNSKELAEIAAMSAKTCRAFNISPRIAMCSYVTGADSAPETLKTREATDLLKKMAPDELVEGPIQYDAAVNPRVAAQKFKGKNSAVAGKANLCIFPDLNVGNIVYKATQQSSGCIAIGPVMQGLRMPVNDLSRGCTVDDVVATSIVTCLQSMDAKQGVPKAKM